MVTFNNISLLSDIVELFYPRICAGCSTPLGTGEETLCLSCLYNLHRTHFHNNRNNPLEQIFWGRVNVKYATALCFYHKESTLQKIIMKLKYHGEKEIGYALGKELGAELLGTEFETIDLLLPIPLHPKRLKKRGYNQAEIIANGIAAFLNKPVDTTSVRRVVATQTQTRKNRFDRWLNVENIFEVTQPQLLSGKHLLIIDDIITTGATIESLITTLNELENITCSIACIGMADNR